MIDTKQIWNDCLVEIETNISGANFNTWFKNTHIAKEDQGTLYIGVPNEFVKDWLNNKFHKLIVKTLMSYMDNIRSVEYIISKHNLIEKEEVKIRSQNNNELPLADLYINKEDNLNKLLDFAKDKKVITNDDARDFLHISQSTATNYLSELVKRGSIKREGKRGGTKYTT